MVYQYSLVDLINFTYLYSTFLKKEYVKFQTKYFKKNIHRKVCKKTHSLFIQFQEDKLKINTLKIIIIYNYKIISFKYSSNSFNIKKSILYLHP